MTLAALVPALLLLAAVLLVAPRREPQRRLPLRAGAPGRRAAAPLDPGVGGDRPGRGRGLGLSGALPRRAVVGVLAAVVVVLVPAPAGVALAVAVLVVVPRVLARLPDHQEPDGLGGLPLAADLLGAAVACGVPPVLALEVVASAVGNEIGRVLARVAGSLRLGAAPASAWASALPEPCPAPLAALARTAARADEGGTRLAVSLTQLADEERARVAARGLDRARRAGVAAVAPLGLCFLPAFLVLGVVPVVLAAAQRLVP